MVEFSIIIFAGIHFYPITSWLTLYFERYKFLPSTTFAQGMAQSAHFDLRCELRVLTEQLRVLC